MNKPTDNNNTKNFWNGIKGYIPFKKWRQTRAEIKAETAKKTENPTETAENTEAVVDENNTGKATAEIATETPNLSPKIPKNADETVGITEKTEPAEESIKSKPNSEMETRNEDKEIDDAEEETLSRGRKLARKVIDFFTVGIATTTTHKSLAQAKESVTEQTNPNRWRKFVKKAKKKFAPNMPWQDAHAKAKAEWQEAIKFDWRGMQLGQGLLGMVGVFFLLISFDTDFPFSSGNLAEVFGCGLFFTIHRYKNFLQAIYHWRGEKIALIFFLTVTLSLIILGVLTGALTIILSLTIFTFIALLAFGAEMFLANSITIVLFVECSVTIGLTIVLATITIVVAGNSTILYIAGVIIITGVIVITGIVISTNGDQIGRALDSYERIVDNHSLISIHLTKDALKFSTLSATEAAIEELLNNCTSLTMGYSGRRGLGKTSLLHNNTPVEEQVKLKKKDLENEEIRRNGRIKEFGFFVRTPTEFSEMNFIIALLEQFSRQMTTILSLRLPVVDTYAIEDESIEKHHLLRPVHYYYIALYLALGAIAFFQFAPKLANNTSFVNLFTENNDSLTVQSASFEYQPTSALYQAIQDSLLENINPEIVRYQSLLDQLNDLLEPQTSIGDWNYEGDSLFSFNTSFDLLETWDSLNRATWPDSLIIDSVLYSTIRSNQDTLHRIATLEAKQKQLQDSLNTTVSNVYGQAISGFGFKNWLFALLAISSIVVPGFIFWQTKEGIDTFRNKEYDPMRNEITLYNRSLALIDRLQNQISVGESESMGASYGWGGFGFSRNLGRSKSKTRRPFTIVSLIEEYRLYMKEVVYYLNKAREVDNKKGEKLEPVKIIIAIDELDKVLDTDRLHEMLKSIKAIFEIPNVYYLLSISEDALGTYRLRHVDTKNEIDSAFTHIINIPPIDATDSLKYYLHYHEGWHANLLPAAIILGGGVLRDINRLSQIFGTHSWEDLHDCLNDSLQEDIEAASDMIRQNPNLSGETKHEWIKRLTSTDCKTKEDVDNLIAVVSEIQLEGFINENPCAESVARKEFHQLRWLVYSMTIKKYIYAQLGKKEMETPASLSTWPTVNDNDKTHMENIDDLITKLALDEKDWLDNLEPYRDAIFNLSNNPLGVWDKLKRI